MKAIEIPRVLGFKRAPHPDIVRMLDVFNDEREYDDDAFRVLGRRARTRIYRLLVVEPEYELRLMQSLQAEAARPFDEMTAGALSLPHQPDSLRTIWEPPFYPPLELRNIRSAEDDYMAVRRALAMLWKHDAAHLIARCVGTCDVRPYLFARDVCDDSRCAVMWMRLRRRAAALDSTWQAPDPDPLDSDPIR